MEIPVCEKDWDSLSDFTTGHALLSKTSGKLVISEWITAYYAAQTIEAISFAKHKVNFSIRNAYLLH